MLPSLTPAARCLDALLRYELATVGSYRSAENVLTADRVVLAVIRRSHELVAATLHQQIAALGQSPSDGPGLWAALPTLVAASTALSARWAVLTALRGVERHGIETYESACRIPILPAEICEAIESTLLPLLHENVRTLEQLSARLGGETAYAAGAARLA